MGFRIRVDQVDYDGENTVLTGCLESGAITGPDSLQVPLPSGDLFVAEIIAIQGAGPMTQSFGNEGSVIQIVLEGSPSPRDIPVPCLVDTVPAPDAPPPSPLARLFWRWIGRR